MFELVAGVRSDDPSWFDFDGVTLHPADIVSLLGPRINDERRANLERALSYRTESIAVVVEGVVDLGNVGAVMRSADGFGIQRFHTVDTADAYKRSRRTSRGTDKWIDRWRWESVETCFRHLREGGYRIAVADAGENATPLAEFDLSGRIAVVFGNELEGVSDAGRQGADDLFTIPMYGFADSFNISVAASIVFYEMRRRRSAGRGDPDVMDQARRDVIRAVWYMKAVRGARGIVERALAEGYRPDST